MEYGPVTEGNLAQLNSGAVFSSARQWRADAFTVPFPERLADMIGEYCDLSAGPALKMDAITELVTAGARKREIGFSRTTFSAWLNGERDPSITGGEEKTRANIYRLAAALDFDVELTCELFEKVFFTRAFNPKSLSELSWYFFAKKDAAEGIYGSDWYEKGLRIAGKAAELDAGSSNTTPISETSVILETTELLQEQEFIVFLKENGQSFSKTNQSMAAKALVRDYAEECSGGPDIAYDVLITEIIGYSQRDTSSAAGPLSGIRSLPPQLTANFPTGRILRAICLNQEDSFDKISKMLKILLFYAFFKDKEDVESEGLFKDFISFTNHELESVGFVDLYPGQPYDGMLLFCAAQNNPVEALREYINRAASAETAAILGRKLAKAFPSASHTVIETVLAKTDRNRFLIDMLCKNCAAVSLQAVPEESDAVLQYLYDKGKISIKEKKILRCMTLVAPEGISQTLFDRIFPDCSGAAAELIAWGWLNISGKNVCMDYRIRKLICEQVVFPRWTDYSEFVLRVMDEYEKTEDPAGRKTLASIIRRASHLGGSPDYLRNMAAKKDLKTKTADRYDYHVKLHLLSSDTFPSK